MVRFNADQSCKPLCRVIVSIPQWFDSTDVERGVVSHMSWVSIPQWFDSTVDRRLEVAREQLGFNPTMVRFNASVRTVISRSRRSFNPTMVRFHAGSVCGVENSWTEFQSHNGSIQRNHLKAVLDRLAEVSIPQWFDSTLVSFWL